METKILARWTQACDFWWSTNLAFYPTDRVWILIGTFVWVNRKNSLPLCNITSPLFRLNLQGLSERCKTWGPLASLLFLTSTIHIWTCTYLGYQLFIGIDFYFLFFSAPVDIRISVTLYHGPRLMCIKQTES